MADMTPQPVNPNDEYDLTPPSAASSTVQPATASGPATSPAADRNVRQTASAPAGDPNAAETAAKAEAAAAAALADAEDIRENRALASVAYMGPLVLVPLIFGRTSPFVRHHTNQGFLLFVAEIFVWAALQALAIPALVIPPLPPLLGLTAFVAWIAFFVFSLRGLASALNGHRSEVPIIGIHKVVE